MDLGDPDQARFVHFWDRIANLARTRDVELIVTSIQGVYTPPLDTAFVTELERRLGASVVQMRRDELGELYATGYADRFHANEVGRQLWSEWLADLLVTRQELGCRSALGGKRDC